MTELGTPDPAIVLAGVHKAYGGLQAVAGVSLEVRRGEFFGLLGPNGAGKTTLVEIMEGLRHADAGTVSVLGMPPWPRDIALLPRIGVQTQSSAFFVRLTAHEHLCTVAALYGADPAAVDRTLALVGLTEQAGSRVDRLSGGQRQRLAIASALVHEPELIFLDEPTAALDPQARRALWQVLRDLKGQGRTIVYTTHHLDEAEALCDRVAILVGGSVAALDTPRRLIGAAGTATRLLVPADRLTVDQARAITGVREVTVEGGALVIETGDDAGPVLAAVNEIAGLQGVQTRTATLEDVYLQLTESR
ncbi:ABC transporter ATP-binding protein [Streptomyces zagrosensis]|nr:ABC transporter ATP-binding protein [Streptomyces zagrosensis]